MGLKHNVLHYISDFLQFFTQKNVHFKLREDLLSFVFSCQGVSGEPARHASGCVKCAANICGEKQR